MKSNGSTYVVVVFAALLGYFSYQWWFNPARAVKKRLGEVAAALSVPTTDTEIGRVARLARLRGYLAEDLQVRIGTPARDLTPRDVVLGAFSTWTPPPGGWDVQFTDSQITMESDSAARAYLTVEMTSYNQRNGQPTLEAREAAVALAKRGGVWVITSAESKETLNRQD